MMEKCLYIYIYIYIYNLIKNFNIKFCDINFIKSHYNNDGNAIKYKIAIPFVKLRYNVVHYGMFFPFFLKNNNMLTSGSHRLLVLYTSNNSIRRLFPVITRKTVRYNEFILPEVFYRNQKWVGSQEDIKNLISYGLYAINGSKSEEIYLVNNSYIKCDYGYKIIKKNIKSEQILYLLIHLNGAEISYDIFELYNKQKLDIISKHPIINCENYSKKYSNKTIKKIEYIFNINR